MVFYIVPHSQVNPAWPQVNLRSGSLHEGKAFDDSHASSQASLRSKNHADGTRLCRPSLDRVREEEY